MSDESSSPLNLASFHRWSFSGNGAYIFQTHSCGSYAPLPKFGAWLVVYGQLIGCSIIL